MTIVPEKKRHIFLDNLKIFFVILVIFMHVLVTYGGQGSWYYNATLNESYPVDLVTMITMYMIAGISFVIIIGLALVVRQFNPLRFLFGMSMRRAAQSK